ncbi:MAG: cobalamin biosynthesis protein CbiD [Eubacterium sp.]|nr:cobalamin biosynthesis protein CbiD [Eubacterium sp.]
MSTTLPKNEQGLRFGYTTGSCATAAAAAAAQMLLCGDEVSTVDFMTPKGIKLQLDIEHITREENRVRCGVKKDAGDDPDITDGIYIYAVAEISEEPGVQIEGGIGVGRVTRPGLDQPVGAAAINHVPREMITQEVSRVMEHARYDGGIRITIEIPEGVSLAAKTFNPRLGIEGGISVLGTSGIVEPMSEDALKATIRAELSVRRAEGHQDVILVPGNYGLDFLRERTMHWDNLQNVLAQEDNIIDPESAVKCSNFIGDAIDMAAVLGFTEVLLVGHIGKLIKLSGGIFNTHSRQADARIDLLVSAGVRADVPQEILKKLYDTVTTEDALRILEEHHMLCPVMDAVKERVDYYLRQRTGDRLEIRAILFSNVYGEL